MELFSSTKSPSYPLHLPQLQTPKDLQPGTTVIHNRMSGASSSSASPSDREILSIEKISRDGKEGWSIVWKTIGMPGGDWTLRAERVQELMARRVEGRELVTEYGGTSIGLGELLKGHLRIWWLAGNTAPLSPHRLRLQRSNSRNAHLHPTPG